ncbi:unnamed protein product, partial [Heterosigma akashiwo]
AIISGNLKEINVFLFSQTLDSKPIQEKDVIEAYRLALSKLEVFQEIVSTLQRYWQSTRQDPNSLNQL